MLELELVDKKDEIAVNSFISQSKNNNFRQTTYWGEIKKASGWHCACYALKKDTQIVAVATILIRKLGRLPFSLMYCCRGPIVDWSNSEVVEELFSQLGGVVKRHNGLCLRFDPEPDEWFEKQQMLLKKHQVFSIPEKVTVWNRAVYSTRVLLNESEEQLFHKMRRTHRQNINKACLLGVSFVGSALPDDKEVFFNLMCGLEERRHSLIHSKNYYDTIYENTVGQNRGTFLKAIYNDEVISGLVVTIVGNRAWALYLANDYSYRKLMPNKLLMWESIKIAKKAGCTFLDLGSTQGTEGFNPNEDNLDMLKSAYRPVIVNFPGYFDVPGKYYRLFRIAEKELFPKINYIYYKAQRILSTFKKK
ncbi:lipid II:glycine glycyltransferase FemX [Pelovirga terrestris]|uniref:Peptidoglycan bridge formation glycyltransferase FemA/FemB family protein n=1 Tax=Pelovirga terrestris TaxID=2771352 RepID=A0A8J6UHI0_9BACT|nr:peptidoglycan bridge formation glycyltransferase FemA/FemB family protein [Pelovirga terrestris]MBD1399345.1 peptidoglycan bridge formation glycyltransferase FemA/FemB family protein [Pelovirga terrestris]